MTFTSVINIIGVNPYVLIPKDIATQLKPNWKKPLPVLVAINAKSTTPYSTNLMPVGDGSFYLYLHGQMRKTSRTNVGDIVTVEITFDANYHNGPLHPLPDWFTQALANNKLAQDNWDKLIPSRKKEILRYFATLQSVDAKKRNLAQAISVLSGHPERFMGRLWTNGK